MQGRLRRLSVIIGVAIVALAGVTQLSAAIRDSSLDTTFGVGGKVTMVNTNLTTQPRRVFVQADGKIVIVGVDQLPTYQVFAVWRYNTDGTPDTSFDGDGKASNRFASQVFAQVWAGALQNDGKIIVVGDVGGIDAMIVRYNTDGTPDTSFDGDGALVTNDGPNAPVPATNESWKGVAVQADGKIVVAGNFGNDFKVARYNTNGTPDTSFDGDGKLTTDIGSSTTDAAWDVSLQSDGKIIVTGTSNDDFAVARYNTDGTPDTSFDGDGKLTTDIGSSTTDAGRQSDLQADGKIVVAGNSSNDIAIVRYNTDGTLDTSFDGDGKLVDDFGDNSSDSLNGLTIDSEGRIFVAGSFRTASFQMSLVASYLPSGAVDTEFDLESVADGSTDALWAITLQPDGKLLATGTYSSAGTPASAYKGLIFRYNAPTVRPTTTTTTTTVAPASTAAASATVASTTVASTTVAPTTTITSTTAAATTATKPSTKKKSDLPATGSSTSSSVVFGSLLLATGLVMLARRRLTR